MKQQTDKSTGRLCASDKIVIGLIVANVVVGLASIIYIGMLTYSALSNTVTAHADAVYNQQLSLTQKYKTGIDKHNERLARAKHAAHRQAKYRLAIERALRRKAKHNANAALSKNKTTESVNTPEAAATDDNHIVQKADGTMVYIVQPGDTLTSISAALGYSVDELANFNQIRNVNLIYAYSALRIPEVE